MWRKMVEVAMLSSSRPRLARRSHYGAKDAQKADVRVAESAQHASAWWLYFNEMSSEHGE